ncbi:hypothetical protein N0V95_006027 [Ascochyta clinopodiicola]|nr:hypothetical protein N0V95_006027 [Ascochyta clinopodiicola]
MSGNWSEAKERIVRLPEDPPTIFHIYVDLLYTNQITVISNSASRVPTLVYDEQNTLARLYVLVEKLQDLDAKNKTLTAMVASLCETYSDGHKYAIGHAAVHIVYEGTPSGSLLRKLIVDTYTSQATRSWVSEAQKLPDDFVRELLISVVAKRSGVPGLVDINDLTAYMELTDTKIS